MRHRWRRGFLALLVAALATLEAAAAEISIVGSSTVYPFMRHVALSFGRRTNTQIALEPTGTETGFDYFCAGNADYLPDINNASFAMTQQQFRNCQRNGVRDIVAFAIGYDGIVVFSDDSSPLTNLSLDELYHAAAAEVPVSGGFAVNPAKSWSEINARLPAEPIRVLGPPPTSGTRVFLEQEVIKIACERHLGRPVRTVAMAMRCAAVRKDGHYVNVSEDDQFLIDAVAQAHNSVGLVGYGQFQLAGPRVKPLSIDAVPPTVANIASGRYPLSRPLFVFVKLASLKRQPEVAALIDFLLSDEMLAPSGELSRLGLILPSEDIRAQNRARFLAQERLTCPSIYCVATGPR